MNSDERVKLMCECVSRDESDVARGVYGEATFFGAFGTISSDLVTHVGGLERAQRQQQLRAADAATQPRRGGRRASVHAGNASHDAHSHARFEF